MMRQLDLVAAFMIAGLAAAIAAPAWNQKDGVIFPSDKAQALLHQCSRGTPQNIKGFWQPQISQIAGLEQLLPGFLEKNLSGQRHPPIQDYGRQYAGLIVKERKIIYVNGFVNGFLSGKKDRESQTWRTNPILVCDGGNGFFGVEYDPQTKSFQSLAFNGVA
jgi:hypothetical protein